MPCPECGSPTRESAAFCTECGAELRVAAESQSSGVPGSTVAQPSVSPADDLPTPVMELDGPERMAWIDSVWGPATEVER
jgi:hypothetical protein